MPLIMIYCDFINLVKTRKIYMFMMSKNVVQILNFVFSGIHCYHVYIFSWNGVPLIL